MASVNGGLGDTLVGMVLAAGRGVRMGPLTDLIPKPALPLVGRPIVELAVETLRRVGVGTLHVNSWHLSHVLAQVIDDCPGQPPVTLHEEAELLGTAGGLRNALGSHPGADVLVMNGDVVYRGSLEALFAAHRERSALATLGLVRIDDPTIPKSVVLGKAGQITSFTGSSVEGGGYTFTGVQLISSAVFAGLPRKGCIVADVYARLLDTGRVIGVDLPGTWVDMGTPERYLGFNVRVAEDRDLLADIRPDLAICWSAPGIVVHPDATVAGSAQLRAPCVVDFGATVLAGAVVGPRAIVGRGALIQPTVQIRDSVVFPGATATHSVSERFVVGQNTVVG